MSDLVIETKKLTKIYGEQTADLERQERSVHLEQYRGLFDTFKGSGKEREKSENAKSTNAAFCLS